MDATYKTNKYHLPLLITAFSELDMWDIVRPKVTEVLVMAEWSEEGFHISQEGEEELNEMEDIATI